MYIQTDTIAIYFKFHLLTNDEYCIQNHKIQENIAAQYFLQKIKRVTFVHFVVKRGGLCPVVFIQVVFVQVVFVRGDLVLRSVELTEISSGYNTIQHSTRLGLCMKAYL